MTRSSETKCKQLGLDFSTASHRLKKSVFHNLVVKSELDICFRCGEKILTPEELSIDHKIDWLHGDFALFWDLDNVTFSHRCCNRPRIGLECLEIRNKCPEGMIYCYVCKSYLLSSSFHPHFRVNKPHKSPECKDCRNEKQRKRRKDRQVRQKQSETA